MGPANITNNTGPDEERKRPSLGIVDVGEIELQATPTRFSKLPQDKIGYDDSSRD